MVTEVELLSGLRVQLTRADRYTGVREVIVLTRDEVAIAAQLLREEILSTVPPEVPEP